MEAVTESITKNRQSDESLRKMIARAFGDDQVPEGTGWHEEFHHGWFNVVYLITLRNGERVVLKIAPPSAVEVMSYEIDMMHNEIAAINVIQQHTDVSVPRVLHFDETRELCDAPYFFMEFFAGENLGILSAQLSPDVNATMEAAMGALNRKLNQIKGPHFGWIGATDTKGQSWREVFTNLVESVLRNGERRNVNIGCDYDLIRSLIDEDAPALDEVTEPVFIEWDMWNLNVIVDDGSIVGIVDHERAMYGDPIMEAGFLAYGMETDFMSAVAFMRGYGKESLAGTEMMRRRLYTLFLMLIMTIETSYRGHTDPTQYETGKGMLGEIVKSYGRS